VERRRNLRTKNVPRGEQFRLAIELYSWSVTEWSRRDHDWPQDDANAFFTAVFVPARTDCYVLKNALTISERSSELRAAGEGP